MINSIVYVPQAQYLTFSNFKNRVPLTSKAFLILKKVTCPDIASLSLLTFFFLLKNLPYLIDRRTSVKHSCFLSLRAILPVFRNGFLIVLYVRKV